MSGLIAESTLEPMQRSVEPICTSPKRLAWNQIVPSMQFYTYTAEGEVKYGGKERKEGTVFQSLGLFLSCFVESQALYSTPPPPPSLLPLQ